MIFSLVSDWCGVWPSMSQRGSGWAGSFEWFSPKLFRQRWMGSQIHRRKYSV